MYPQFAQMYRPRAMIETLQRHRSCAKFDLERLLLENAVMMRLKLSVVWLVAAMVVVGERRAAAVVVPYFNDFSALDVSAFTEVPDERWSPTVGGYYRYRDTVVDATNVVDRTLLWAENLGGAWPTNFTFSVKFRIVAASQTPAGSGSRLAIMLAALADSTLSSGYFFSIGAGEDIAGFEEGMAFYKNGTFSGQTTNFPIVGPTTDNSETWKLTVKGEYLSGDRVRFTFIALNEARAEAVTNRWTDDSGALLSGQFFGLVVAHTRYTCEVYFDDFVLMPGLQDAVVFLPPGALFLDEFILPLSMQGWTVLKSYPIWYGVTNQQCYLRAQQGDMAGRANDYWDLVVRGLPEITEGDMCITLAVANFQPTNDQVQVAGLVWMDQDNFVRASYGHLDGQRRLRLVAETNGVPWIAAEEVRDFDFRPFWLRLTRQRDIYRMYWSTNGIWFHRVPGDAKWWPDTPAQWGFWAGGDSTFVGLPPTVAWLESVEVRQFPDFPVLRPMAPGVRVYNLYAGTTARVERVSHLATGTWNVVAQWPVQSDSTNWADTTVPTPALFYRVRVDSEVRP